MVNFQDPKTRKMLMIGGVVLVVIIIIIVVVMSKSSKSKSHADKAKAAAAQAQIHAKKATEQAQIAKAAAKTAAITSAKTASPSAKTPSTASPDDTFEIRVAAPTTPTLNYLGVDSSLNLVLVDETSATLWQLDSQKTVFTVINGVKYMITRQQPFGQATPPKLIAYDSTASNKYAIKTFNTSSKGNSVIDTVGALMLYDAQSFSALMYYQTYVNPNNEVLGGMANVIYTEYTS